MFGRAEAQGVAGGFKLVGRSRCPTVAAVGPVQPHPPGLQLVEQGQLGVVHLGPLFDAELPGVEGNDGQRTT